MMLLRRRCTAVLAGSVSSTTITTNSVRCCSTTPSTTPAAAAAAIAPDAATTEFLAGNDWAYLRTCIADLKQKQDTYGQKQNEMERTQRVAKYVGLDMDSAKPAKK
eukprot:PhM_4_TR17835/c0_g1_i1/m.9019